jgi:hypothetical protein
VSLSEFKDKLDLEAGATVAGHSFGGATTVLSLAKVIFCYFLQCCGTGTVGTVTFCRLELEPELITVPEP